MDGLDRPEGAQARTAEETAPARQRAAGAPAARHSSPLSTLIDALPTPVFYKDRFGRYLGGNQAFEAFVGQPLADVVGKTVYDLAPAEFAAEYHQADAALFEHPGTQTYAAHVRHADGSTRQVVFNKSTYFDADGKVAGIVGSIHDITERRTLERRLVASETHFRELAEGSIQGIVIHRDLEPLFVNQAFATAFGYTIDELLGLPSILPCVAPSERERLLGYCAAAGSQSGHIPPHFEFGGIRRDGEPIWLECRAMMVSWESGPAIQFTVSDISQRKESQAALAASEAQLTAIWETIQAGVVVVEEDTQRIRDLNPAAKTMLDCTRDQAVGQHCTRPGCRNGSDLGCLLDCRQADGRQKPIVLRAPEGERHLIRSATRAVIGTHRVCVLSLLDVTELMQAREELERSHRENAALIAGINSILIALSRDLRVTQWNEHAELAFARPAAETLAQDLFALGLSWDEESVRAAIDRCRDAGEVVRLDSLRFQNADGQQGYLGLHVSPIRYEAAGFDGVLIMGADITHRRLQEREMTQAQKLESIGQLAAGIAHEINTPTQYVGDNTRFLKDCFGDLMHVIDSFRKLLDNTKTISSLAGLAEEAEERMAAADLDYLAEEIPLAIEQTLEGIDRVSNIVRSMKEFSHPAMDQKAPVDLNKALESTLTVSRNEWKYCAELETDFAADLPLVPCFAGELNQVFLNIIVNAAHAIEGVLPKEGGAKGKIRVSTRCRGDNVEVRIGDTGGGIPEEIRHRIFDPFFTTKEVGKGTGQGLAIAHRVVTEKHGGSLEIETETGRGTTLVMRLPIGETK